jgi:hypothetical protein
MQLELQISQQIDVNQPFDDIKYIWKVAIFHVCLFMQMKSYR